MKVPVRALAAGLLLLTFGLGCDSVTPIAPADAILSITVNPTRIESDGQATITVLARKTDGFPVNEGTEITFSTDLGRLDPERAFTDEQGRATTTLFGNGEVGLATVTAVSGSIEITAETAVQIGSIPNSLVLEVTPAEINIQDIDRERIFRLRASVVDDLGEPLQNATVRFEAETGKLASRGEPVKTNANGVARDSLTVKKSQLENAGSSFFVTAIVTGGDQEGFVELIADEEVFIFGYPFDIFLETSQSSVPVEGASIQLIATVLDDLGETIEGARVQFESSAGRVASLGGVVRTDVNGQAFDFLEITETDLASLPVATNSVSVTARVLGQDDLFISDTADLNVQGRPPIANFTFALDCANVTFTNTSSPMPTPEVPVEFVWDFGDGSGLTVTEVGTPPPITNSYNAPSTFMVSLTATNVFGTSTQLTPVTLDPTPTAAFTATAVTPSGSVPAHTIDFDASATQAQGSVTYAWDFDSDGVINTTRVDNPTVRFTYAAAGNPTVTLTVTACTGQPGFEAQASTSATISVP